MELKEGMYVRTKHYGVFKILKIIKENNSIKFLKELGHTVEVENKKYKYYLEEEVLKVRHDIIDLIEEGDYVNGYKVKETGIEELGHTYLSLDMNEDIHWLESEIENEEQIKSIVTKEQFLQTEYKVGD